jgi:hypothetical protein
LICQHDRDFADLIACVQTLTDIFAAQGDIADLGLTFSVTDTSMGGQREVELLPGGAAMDVTSQNRCAATCAYQTAYAFLVLVSSASAHGKNTCHRVCLSLMRSY